MGDMLVNLTKLPNAAAEIERLASEGIIIRKAHPWDVTPVRRFIEKHFCVIWADEVSNAFPRQPPTCMLATHEQKVIGFAAFECSRRAFFGPTGVNPEYRGRGIGKALLIEAMRNLWEMGYAYAIIGGAGPTEFYSSTLGAIPIPGSEPGIYVDMLDPDKCD